MVTQFSMLAFTSTWRSLWRVMLIAYLAKSSLAADQDIILDSYNFHDSILNGSLIVCEINRIANLSLAED